MQESEIEAMVNDGGDLGDSTRSFLEQRRSEAEYDHRMLYLINAFAAAGGLLGILCIPGSYELVKKRAAAHCSASAVPAVRGLRPGGSTCIRA